MKWLLALLLLAQAPFLFIIFIAAGADGKRSSIAPIYATVIPIALCGIALLARIVGGFVWQWYDGLLALIALSPCLLIGWHGFRRRGHRP